MKTITFSPSDIEKIRAGRMKSVRVRFRPPSWWEGHRIGYKVYPFGDGTYGHYAETMCARDGGRQRRNPYGEPGDLLQGAPFPLEIDSVELAGEERADKLAARSWVIRFRRVDTNRRPMSMAKAYSDLPAKGIALMVARAAKRRAEHLAALGPLRVGDVLVAAAPRPDAHPFTMTLLEEPGPIERGSMFFARIDYGEGDVREGYYDVDRHSGRLYGGPEWKRVTTAEGPPR